MVWGIKCILSSFGKLFAEDINLFYFLASPSVWQDQVFSWNNCGHGEQAKPDTAGFALLWYTIVQSQFFNQENRHVRLLLQEALSLPKWSLSLWVFVCVCVFLSLFPLLSGSKHSFASIHLHMISLPQSLQTSASICREALLHTHKKNLFLFLQAEQYILCLCSHGKRLF